MYIIYDGLCLLCCSSIHTYGVLQVQVGTIYLIPCHPFPLPPTPSEPKPHTHTIQKASLKKITFFFLYQTSQNCFFLFFISFLSFFFYFTSAFYSENTILDKEWINLSVKYLYCLNSKSLMFTVVVHSLQIQYENNN